MTTANNKTSLKEKSFYPEIESLRALAVIMVLMAHFIPEKSPFHVPYMWYGVDLFFTISGFLITSILLNARNNKIQPNSSILKNFYIRRVLRLFPIYYLFILFFFLGKHVANLYMWKDEYNFYFFTYFQNIYFFKLGSFNSLFSHLWSLGVEEQFYLVWPFLVLFLPKRGLPWLFGFVIILSLVLNTLFQTTPMFRNLTFANFHTLGIGALFAYYHVNKPENINFESIVKHRTLISLALTPLLFIVLKYNHILGYSAPFFLELFLALTTVSLVITSTYGWQFHMKSITQNKALMHIGKISYGIYLFHLPLPALTRVLFEKFPGNKLTFHHEMISILFYTLLTIFLAHISFRFIEKPFLQLKTKFE